MYQAKVRDTQKYEDSQGSHVVTTGKLILLEPEQCEALKLSGNHRYKKLKPIIISETEEVEVGDWFYSRWYKGESNGYIFKEGEKLYASSFLKPYKILALTEHFSDKHLQAIADGKIEDGDEVLIKCDYTDCERNKKGHCIEQPNCLQWLHSQTSGVTKPDHVDCDMRPIVYLDQQNHITLFPAKQKEQECTLGVGDGDGDLFVHGSYEAIKRVQNMIFELEELKSDQQTKQSLEEAAFDELKNYSSKYEASINSADFPKYVRGFKDGAEWTKKNNY